MKVYHGYRIFETNWRGDEVISRMCNVVVWCRSSRYDLPVRLDLRNHSPTGFDWGYSGSGPAQLALALVADCMGDELVYPSIYQTVKFKLVANFPPDAWTLTEEDLRLCVAARLSEIGSEPADAGDCR
jgi:hypothetical protein